MPAAVGAMTRLQSRTKDMAQVHFGAGGVSDSHGRCARVSRQKKCTGETLMPP